MQMMYYKQPNDETRFQSEPQHLSRYLTAVLTAHAVIFKSNLLRTYFQRKLVRESKNNKSDQQKQFI